MNPEYGDNYQCKAAVTLLLISRMQPNTLLPTFPAVCNASVLLFVRLRVRFLFLLPWLCLNMFITAFLELPPMSGCLTRANMTRCFLLVNFLQRYNSVYIIRSRLLAYTRESKNYFGEFDSVMRAATVSLSKEFAPPDCDWSDINRWKQVHKKKLIVVQNVWSSGRHSSNSVGCREVDSCSIDSLC